MGTYSLLYLLERVDKRMGEPKTVVNAKLKLKAVTATMIFTLVVISLHGGFYQVTIA